MKKLFGILVSCLLICSFSFAIDLSEYSEEEQKQYKEIKKLKEKVLLAKTI